MSQNIENKIGFSTFTGVFVPNVTMMFGVILYMRLGVVLGNLGMARFLIVISLSLTLMLITSFSIASIVSNMKVGSGGVYYLISRSLGIEIGGACGLALVLAQLFSFTLVVTGFGYSFHHLFPDTPVIQVELIAMFALLALSIYSANLALKTQILIFYLLLLSVTSIFFSTMQTQIPELPLSISVSEKMGFWGGFAVFYPALTGIEAGMALSGNLKNPSKSLVWGNLLSLLFVAGVYTAVAIVLWLYYPLDLLKSSPFLVLTDSKFPVLIYFGIWCATLSSALGNLLGAPRMLQMIAEDGIAPEFLSRVYGKHKEPRWAIGVIFILAIGFILFTTLDQVIPMLSMICLLTYGILNLVASMAELIHSVSWRPKIRCPWQLSAFGAFLAFFLMLMIDPVWTVIAIFLVTAVYVFLRTRGLEVPFKDFRDNILFFFSRFALYRLSSSEDHPTNWQPQIILFCRNPMQQQEMVQIADAIAERGGILTLATIVPEYWNEPEKTEGVKRHIMEWLADNSIECLLEVQDYPSFYEGVENLVKIYGIGPLQPNSVMLSVSDVTNEEMDGFIQVIQAAKVCKKNVILKFNSNDPIKKMERCDLWWDPDYRESFELILSYLLSLRRNKFWQPEIITLRAVVSDENAKKHLFAHFQQLFHQIRIRANPVIEVVEECDFHESIARFSSDADLILFPLRTLDEFEDSEEFKKYFSKLKEKLPENIPMLSITSYDRLNHKEIYASD